MLEAISTVTTQEQETSFQDFEYRSKKKKKKNIQTPPPPAAAHEMLGV